MSTIVFNPEQQTTVKNETPPEDGNSIKISSIRAMLLVDNPLFTSPHPALSVDVSILSPNPPTRSSDTEPLSAAMSELASPTPSTNSTDSDLPDTFSDAMTGLSSPTPSTSEAALYEPLSVVRNESSSSLIPSLKSSSIPSTASEALPDALSILPIKRFGSDGYCRPVDPVEKTNQKLSQPDPYYKKNNPLSIKLDPKEAHPPQKEEDFLEFLSSTQNKPCQQKPSSEKRLPNFKTFEEADRKKAEGDKLLSRADFLPPTRTSAPRGMSHIFSCFLGPFRLCQFSYKAE